MGGHGREVGFGDAPLGLHAALADALDQGVGACLQVDHQIGLGRCGRFHRVEHALIQRTLFVGEVQAGKEGVFLEQEVGNDAGGFGVVLG